MEELVEHVLNLESSFFGITATELKRLAHQLTEKYKLQHCFLKRNSVCTNKILMFCINRLIKKVRYN